MTSMAEKVAKAIANNPEFFHVGGVLTLEGVNPSKAWLRWLEQAKEEECTH